MKPLILSTVTFAIRSLKHTILDMFMVVYFIIRRGTNRQAENMVNVISNTNMIYNKLKVLDITVTMID